MARSNFLDTATADELASLSRFADFIGAHLYSRELAVLAILSPGGQRLIDTPGALPARVYVDGVAP